MKIDKNMILDMLRQRGDQDKAQAAERELPGEVDTEDAGHKGLLDKLGIDLGMLQGLAGKLPGGITDKLPGGIGKILGR
jgi:hypothetical protein